MTTGLHTVRDITCAKCGTLLGWKYGQSPTLTLSAPPLTAVRRVDKAYEESQKYKEGKYILEKSLTGTSISIRLSADQN